MIKDYADKGNFSSLISGGIDSAVTSTLSARTNLHTHVVTMPILDHQILNNRGNNHIKWLKKIFQTFPIIMLIYQKFLMNFNQNSKITVRSMDMLILKLDLRMTTLYQIAASNNGIVVGTGNKVEDFGIGFYTKYGDGGVDISPIADCLKTEVWDIGKELGINQEIIDAAPTDGLWTDGRTDEQQVGLSYEEIEEAMLNEKSSNRDKYLEIRSKNVHKMEPIPVCIIPK